MRLFLCLSLIGLLHYAHAQKSTFPDGLKKISDEEVTRLKLEADSFPGYGPNGQLWTKVQVRNKTGLWRYRAEFYADEQGKVVAVKYQKRTHTERMSAISRAEEKRMNALVGTPAPDFEVSDMEGNHIKLSDLKGQIAVVNFWFTNCKYCRKEMPELNAIVEDYKDKPVKFIAIATDNKEELDRFLKFYSFDYRIVPDGQSVVNTYKVLLFPSHLVVDQEGNITYFKSGDESATTGILREKLDALLGQ